MKPDSPVSPVWRRAVVRHKPLAGGAGLMALLLLLSVTLALGQWDAQRITFEQRFPLELALERGDERFVYLTANDSANLDIAPSDFSCVISGPAGQVEVEPERGQRLLNVWERHAAIGRFVASDSGVHTLTCEGRADTLLIVARPVRFTTVGWLSPLFTLLLILLVAFVSSVLLAFSAVARRLWAAPRR